MLNFNRQARQKPAQRLSEGLGWGSGLPPLRGASTGSIGALSSDLTAKLIFSSALAACGPVPEGLEGARGFLLLSADALHRSTSFHRRTTSFFIVQVHRVAPYWNNVER